jgi:hypothetical protein
MKTLLDLEPTKGQGNRSGKGIMDKTILRDVYNNTVISIGHDIETFVKEGTNAESFTRLIGSQAL